LGHDERGVELALDVEAVGKRQLDRAASAARRWGRRTLALEILDPEGVERHAVGQGEDLGIDDVGR